MEIDRLEELNGELAELESEAHNIRELVLDCLKLKRAIQDETILEEIKVMESQAEELEEEIEERLKTFP